MTAGRANLRLHGGPFGGECRESVPTGILREVLALRLGTYLCETPGSSDISVVMVGQGPVPKRWIIGTDALYRKRLPTHPGEGIDYDFECLREVGRCMAVTLKGNQCLQAAAEGSALCEGSHRSTTASLALIDEGFVREQLQLVADGSRAGR